jgi:hypothetical protein
MVFSFADEGEFSLPRGSAALFFQGGVEWGGGYWSGAWYMILSCFFCSFTQPALEPAGMEKWRFCFSAAQHRETFLGLGVQDVIHFDSD